MPKIQKPRGLKQKYSAILSFLFDHQRNLESGGYYKTFAKTLRFVPALRRR